MINRQRAILKSVMIVFFSTTLYVYLFRSKHIEKILPGLLATFLSLLKSSSRNNMPAHEIIVRDKPVTKLKPIEYCTEISADLIQAESLSFAAARHLLQAPGSEFRINNFFILSQSNVQVLPSLSPVNPTQWAVYTSEGFQDPSGLALALQRLDSAGEKVGTEVRVNSQVGGDQFNARTCMTNLNGDFRAVFQTTTSGSGLNSPRVRDFNPNGIPQGDEYSLNVITEGDQSNAVCAGNMVVWTSNHLGLNKLFARCKVGGVWQETVAVANISNAYQQQPSLINSFDFLSQLVVFESNHTGISEIYAQAFNTTCNALTSTIPISQAGGTLPSVTVLDNSEYVTSYLQNNEIKAQRLDADYTRTGAQVAVANDVSVKTSVAPLTSGGFAVGYESADNVYVQYFDYGNTPWFDAVEVGFSGNARRPSLGFMQSIYSPIDSLGSMLVVSDHNDDIWGFIYNAPPVIRFTSVGSIPIPIERSEVPLNQDKFIGDPDHYVLSSAVLTTNITQDVFAITNVNPIFSINGNTSDTLTLSGQASFATYKQELNKITYRPDHNQPGDRVITYTLTDPSDAQGSADIVANVGNLVTASPPTLNINASFALEDQWALLDIKAELIAPEDETLSVKIINIPVDSMIRYLDSSSESVLVPIVNNVINLQDFQLNQLQIMLKEHGSGVFNLQVEASAMDKIGGSESTIKALALNVEAVADPPLLNAQNVTGLEDQAIALNVSSALVDTDGSESLAIEFHNVPAQALLDQGTLLNTVWHLTSEQLLNLILMPPLHFKGQIPLQVRAISTEISNSDTAVQIRDFNVEVIAVADTPSLNAQNVTGFEDEPIALNVTAALTDGSETLAIQLHNMPAQAFLNQGFLNNTVWQLTSTQLLNLMLMPPLNFKGQIPLQVRAISTEISNSDTAVQIRDFNVEVIAVADTPSVNAQNVTGFEDQPIALNVSAALTDASESLTIVFYNVPAQAFLDQGALVNTVWQLTSEQLLNLMLMPPLNFKGQIPLQVRAIATESSNSDTAVQIRDFNVEVIAVADQPLVTARNVTGFEDQPIALNVSAALTDESEFLAIEFHNVPAQALLDQGALVNTVWQLTSEQLLNLMLMPPLHFKGQIPLQVRAISTESSNSDMAVQIRDFNVQVIAVADQPSVNAQNVSGLEDQPIALNVSAALTDASESLTIEFHNVPVEALLDQGTLLNTVWQLTPTQLLNLMLTPPLHFKGQIPLQVRAIATESSNSDMAVQIRDFNVEVIAVADTPSVTAQNVSGLEDQPIALNVSAALTDASETLAIEFHNVPVEASLNTGTLVNMVWHLLSQQLLSLKLIPPLNFNGQISLLVRAIATEISNSDTAVIERDFNVEVIAVANMPSLNAQNVTGLEDQPIALNVSAALVDTDGSESLAVEFHNVPVEASLNNGTLVNMVWHLLSQQLLNLKLIPPLNFNGQISLLVRAIATEISNSATALITQDFSVSVNPVADGLVLQADDVDGLEDQPVGLSVSVQQMDPNELLRLQICGIPPGFELNSVVNDSLPNEVQIQDDVAQIDNPNFDHLYLTPALHVSGFYNLTVIATTFEVDATNQSVTKSFRVHIIGVADIPILLVFPAVGTVNNTVPLNISASVVGFNESLSLQISNIPFQVLLHYLNNSFVTPIEVNNAAANILQQQLTGLVLRDISNEAKQFDLNVTATSHQGQSEANANRLLPVTILETNFPPLIEAPDIIETIEDTALNLNISVIPPLINANISVVLSNLFDTMRLSYLNRVLGRLNILISSGQAVLRTSELNELMLLPQLNYAGNLSLLVTAETYLENSLVGQADKTIILVVYPVADLPLLQVQAIVANEDENFSLNITPQLSDTDGSEYLSNMTISGVPMGSQLFQAAYLGNGIWSISPMLANQVLQLPVNYEQSFNLTAIVSSFERDNLDQATTSATFPVLINPVADAPVANDATYSIMENDTQVMQRNYLQHVTDVDLDDRAQLVLVNGSENSHLRSNYANFTWFNNGNFHYALHIDNVRHLGAGESVSDVYLLTVRDRANLTAVGRVTFIIRGVNSAPIIVKTVNSILILNASEPFTFIVDHFRDPEDDVWSLQVRPVETTVMPNWMFIDEEDHIISGYPDRSQVVSLTLRALDEHMAMSLPLFLDIQVNAAPLQPPPTQPVSEKAEFPWLLAGLIAGTGVFGMILLIATIRSCQRCAVRRILALTPSDYARAVFIRLKLNPRRSRKQVKLFVQSIDEIMRMIETKNISVPNRQVDDARQFNKLIDNLVRAFKVITYQVYDHSNYSSEQIFQFALTHRDAIVHIVLGQMRGGHEDHNILDAPDMSMATIADQLDQMSLNEVKSIYDSTPETYDGSSEDKQSIFQMDLSHRERLRTFVLDTGPAVDEKHSQYFPALPSRHEPGASSSQCLPEMLPYRDSPEKSGDETDNEVGLERVGELSRYEGDEDTNNTIVYTDYSEDTGFTDYTDFGEEESEGGDEVTTGGTSELPDEEEVEVIEAAALAAQVNAFGLFQEAKAAPEDKDNAVVGEDSDPEPEQEPKPGQSSP